MEAFWVIAVQHQLTNCGGCFPSGYSFWVLLSPTWFMYWWGINPFTFGLVNFIPCVGLYVKWLLANLPSLDSTNGSSAPLVLYQCLSSRWETLRPNLVFHTILVGLYLDDWFGVLFCLLLLFLFIWLRKQEARVMNQLDVWKEKSFLNSNFEAYRYIRLANLVFGNTMK